MAGYSDMQSVEVKVENDGVVILNYCFRNIQEATEIFVYLREFFPDGTFVIQPLRH